MGNSQRYEDPKLWLEKSENLKNNINILIENQKNNIKKVFEDNSYQTQSIQYSINADYEFQKEDNFKSLDDYAIQWSIKGNKKLNTTNCHLTLFNIGGLLGCDGFLYSIGLFYYYFMKIPFENRENKEVIKDIETCLQHIDNGNIIELNLIWRVELNENILNNLRYAKDFLINLFHDKITNEIYENLTHNILSKMFKKVKSFGKGVCRIFSCIFFFFISSNNSNNENFKKNKNRFNKEEIHRKILENLNLKFFENYNIFIIASDDDINPKVNYGATFTGCYIEGLGEQERARKLVENKKDGFTTGNLNNDTKKLFEFYKNKINELQQFFERNKTYIDNIRKGLNVDDNLNEIINDIDDINKRYLLSEGSIDNELSNRETARSTNLEKANSIGNDVEQNNNPFKKISQEQQLEAKEFEKYLDGKKSLFDEIYNNNYHAKVYTNNNIIYHNDAFNENNNIQEKQIIYE